eukprot:m.39490 g.39490  ORF g.39490 m.39490 type:complete len:1302 (+) comp11781_c0_seq1:532-4437(+)
MADDLASLTTLDEASLNNALADRYSRKIPYTYVGDVLVAVNPYEQLPLYSSDIAMQYKQASRATLPPHIFAIADAAFTTCFQTSQSQVCVISGESGAGKTESTKYLIRHILDLAPSVNPALHKRILQINPVLEAFGNAATVMNHNSSRFGKFIDLRLTRQGSIGGATLSHYLLEKSRVVQQSSHERNFHVFYYMLHGLSPAAKKALQLGTEGVLDFRYLAANSRPTPANEGARSWNELQAALADMQLSAQEIESITKIMTGILLLGNTSFTETANEEAQLKEAKHVDRASAVWQIDPDKLINAMLKFPVTIRGETIEKNNNARQASETRDAAAKAVYGRFFAWLVQRVNGSLFPGDADINIGLLDIFGFENFTQNSFEQLCINLANEHLQAFFNKHIFQRELQEYEKEGISRLNVEFIDNTPLLQMITGRPLGMLAILDEESRLQSSTDNTLRIKFQATLGKQPLFRALPSGFVVVHYAGEVEYEVEHMIAKNRDPLPELISVTLAGSQCALLSLLFVDAADEEVGQRQRKFSMKGRLSQQRKSGRGKSAFNLGDVGAAAAAASPKHGHNANNNNKNAAKRSTVSSEFYQSLMSLMQKMEPRGPHFVRCLKPNGHSRPNSYEHDFVLSQLRYTGMLETVRIRREGFSYRPFFNEFIARFRFLGFNSPKKIDTSAANCKVILKAAGISGWEMGKTRVFLKYFQEDELVQQLCRLSKYATTIQRWMRGFVCRKQYLRARAQIRLERLAAEGFLKDMKALSDRMFNTLINICDEDAYRKRDQQRFGPNGFELQPEPLISLPDPVLKPKAHEKSVKKLREQSENWFRTQELPRGAVFDSSSNNNNGNGNGNGNNNKTSTISSVGPIDQFGNGNAVSLAPWFHGLLSRAQAEECLHGHATGTYLIRVSEARAGYALSVVANGRTKHYKILQNNTNLTYVVVGTMLQFVSLHDLVAHFQSNPISRDKDQLVHPLKRKDNIDIGGPEAAADVVSGSGFIRAAVQQQLQQHHRSKQQQQQQKHQDGSSHQLAGAGGSRPATGRIADASEAESIAAATSFIRSAVNQQESVVMRPPSKPRPSDFVRIMAPLIETDVLGALDGQTLTQLESRYGNRQIPEDSVFRHSFLPADDDKVPADRQASDRGSAPSSPAPKRPLGQKPQLRYSRGGTLELTEGELLRRDAVMADAERRISLAKQEWEKNMPKKARKEAEKRRKEQEKREKKLAKEAQKVMLQSSKSVQAAAAAGAAGASATPGRLLVGKSSKKPAKGGGSKHQSGLDVRPVLDRARPNQYEENEEDLPKPPPRTFHV